MPQVVQFPMFTLRRTRFETVQDVELWLDSFVNALQRFWVQQAYVINALSQTGTAAQRPAEATAILDDGFFTETDSNQTFVAVAGAWRSLGTQRDVQSFAFFLS